jgi:hypothetical protein
MTDEVNDPKATFTVSPTKVPPAASNTLTQGKRVYTLEGDKEVIEDHFFHLRVLSDLTDADAGVHTFEGVKVTISVK